LEDNKEIVLKI